MRLPTAEVSAAGTASATSTCKEEFRSLAFRRRVYRRSAEETLVDLGEWLGQHNNERTHSGRYCYGKTPMQTFMDSIPLARERLFGHDESDGRGA